MTKVVSLSDAAYGTLKGMKGAHDSFSDVVLRLAEHAPRKSLIDFFGKWPGSSDEAERIKKQLYDARKRFKTREVRSVLP